MEYKSPFGDERKSSLESYIHPECAEILEDIVLNFEPIVLGITFWNCYSPWNVPERRICDNFFYMTTSGEEEATVEGKRTIMKRGDIMIVPEYTRHSFGLAKNCAESSHFIAHALIENITGVNPFACFKSPFIRLREPETVIEKLTWIVSLRNVNHDAAALAMRQLFKDIICECAIAGKFHSRATAHYDERVMLALQYINENFTGNIAVADIAAHTGLGEVRFRKIFNAGIGMTPAAYLLRTRLIHAARLLLRYDLSLREIVALSGFSGECYFCTAFRKIFGRTPGDYRKFMRRN